MKKVFNILFYAIACGALGLGIGAQVAGTDMKLLVIVPYIIAGIFYILGIIMSSLVIADAKNKRNIDITLQKKDIILQIGETYTVSKRGLIHAGKYQVLATNENDKSVNIRLNDFVKEYKHNTALVLANGDTISARSSNVILRQ